MRDAYWYVERNPLGCGGNGCKASQGDSFWTAKNPDFGATFTYYLADGLKTRKEARREIEKEKEKKNDDVVAADWGTVINESREDAPAVVFTIRSADGAIVNQVEGPATPGFHRVAWNLRHPSVEPWSPPDPQQDEPEEGAGILVVPGQFTVEMQHRIDGELVDIGQTQAFNVVSIRPDPVLPGSTQEQRVIFESKVDELIRAATGSTAAIDAVIAELDAVKATLDRSQTDGSLYELANSIQQRIKAQRDRINGNEMRDMYNDLPEMPVTERLWHARFAPSKNAHGPTPAQQESLRIARKLYDEVYAELTELVEDEYAGLKEAMDTARVPYTPGRGLQN